MRFPLVLVVALAGVMTDRAHAAPYVRLTDAACDVLFASGAEQFTAEREAHARLRAAMMNRYVLFLRSVRRFTETLPPELQAGVVNPSVSREDRTWFQERLTDRLRVVMACHPGQETYPLTSDVLCSSVGQPGKGSIPSVRFSYDQEKRQYVIHIASWTIRNEGRPNEERLFDFQVSAPLKSSGTWSHLESALLNQWPVRLQSLREFLLFRLDLPVECTQLYRAREESHGRLRSPGPVDSYGQPIPAFRPGGEGSCGG